MLSTMASIEPAVAALSRIPNAIKPAWDNVAGICLVAMVSSNLEVASNPRA